jgi:capsid protein
MEQTNISTTVEANVPETAEKIRVRFSGLNARQLAAWAAKQRQQFRYDAAQTNDGNSRHWAVADNLSARAANSLSVRQTLRKRSRYEVANNTYAKGIVGTLANHVIGLGPRVQAVGVPRETNKWLRKEFRAWGRQIGLASKLRTMRRARCQDGEAFGILTTNLNLDSEVKLDLRLIEADQVSDTSMTPDPRNIDGVILDVFFNPSEYRVLRAHPGDSSYTGGANQHDTIPAASMCHWFASEDRPGIYRGVPEITPALPLFAMLRRFTLAVIAAAEAAASAAGVVYSDQSPNDEDEDLDAADDDPVAIERGMWVTLPKGWKLGQVEAEQPTTTYAEFKREIIKEIARPLHMPYNIAAGDSSDYNFASGKLDKHIYVDAIWIDREECERIVLDKLLRAWIREARLVPDYVPAELGRGEIEVIWNWDALNFEDEGKLANARNVKLGNGSLSLTRLYAEDGLEIEEELQTIADESGKKIEEVREAIFNKRFTMSGIPPNAADEWEENKSPNQGKTNEKPTDSSRRPTARPSPAGRRSD